MCAPRASCSAKRKYFAISKPVRPRRISPASAPAGSRVSKPARSTSTCCATSSGSTRISRLPPIRSSNSEASYCLVGLSKISKCGLDDGALKEQTIGENHGPPSGYGTGNGDRRCSRQAKTQSAYYPPDRVGSATNGAKGGRRSNGSRHRSRSWKACGSRQGECRPALLIIGSLSTSTPLQSKITRPKQLAIIGCDRTATDARGAF